MVHRKRPNPIGVAGPPCISPRYVAQAPFQQNRPCHRRPRASGTPTSAATVKLRGFLDMHSPFIGVFARKGFTAELPQSNQLNRTRGKIAVVPFFTSLN